MNKKTFLPHSRARKRQKTGVNLSTGCNVQYCVVVLNIFSIFSYIFNGC